ncbi:MAG: CoA pyrophosphatase [Candidatus Dadabacteria bacterium]|nr:MAG: CoA pyrophosphatase [Candidatus Dadabacteria bacterium]
MASDTLEPDRLSRDAAALRARLGDILLPPGATDDALYPDHRDAAVLVPFVIRDGVPYLLFLLRPETMREHAGQVAFPGGRVDPGETKVEAALREAQEELGIEPATVDVVGQVRGIPTVTSYWVTPVVGWLEQPPVLHPNPGEVAEVFEVALSELLRPEAYEGNPVIWRGRQGWVDYFRVRDTEGKPRIVWGATGRMLHQFFEQVFGWEPPDPRWHEIGPTVGEFIEVE